MAKLVRKFEIHVIWDRCKGCGFCIEFCPRGVLDYSPRLNARGAHPPEVVKPEECVGCGLCQDICPDLAIFVVPVEAPSCLLYTSPSPRDRG